VVFLFHPQERPGIGDIKRAIAGIEGAHCGAELVPLRGSDAVAMVELQKGGMTYDCVGLVPGPPAQRPGINHALDLHEDPHLLESIGLGLGPHVQAGKASLPVLKALLGFSAALAVQFEGCVGVCWDASGTAASPTVFRTLVDAWESGGGLPSPLLFSTKDAIDGGMESRGLRYFTGQELRFEPDIVRDRERADHLNLRLAEQMLRQGRLATVEQFTAPDGMPLRLEPSPNGRFVRVRAG